MIEINTGSTSYQSGYTEAFGGYYPSGYTSGFDYGHSSGVTAGIADVPLEDKVSILTSSGEQAIIPSQGYSGMSQVQLAVDVGGLDTSGYTQYYYLNTSNSTGYVTIENGMNPINTRSGSTKILIATCRGPMIDFGLTDSNFNQISSITFTEGLEYFGIWFTGLAAYRRAGMFFINFPPTLRVLQFNALRTFSGVTYVNLEETILESVGAFAFSGCTSLTALTLPSTVKYIGTCAFSSMGYQGHFIIPDSVITICKRPFSGSTGITEVTIGSGITCVPSYLFDGCPNVATVHYTGTVAMWNDLWKGTDWKGNITATVIRCSDGNVSIT